MNHLRAVRLVGTLVFALLLSLPALGVSAANPGHTWGSPEIDNVDCAFPVTLWYFGLATSKDFFDKNGNLVATRWTYPDFRIGFEANGKWLETRSAGSIWIRLNADGSTTVSWSGMQGKFTVPGQGLVVADIGHLVIRFLDPAPSAVLQVTGHYNQTGDPYVSPWPFLCSALAP